MIRFSKHIAVVVLLLTNCCAYAAIKLPAIISDNMVLQQKTTITLWGWADPGEMVTVNAGWQKDPVKAKTDASGAWNVQVKTAAAGGPYTITFTGTNSIEVQNVKLGEVWLASGQSN